jgi:hypothetical protein
MDRQDLHPTSVNVAKRFTSTHLLLVGLVTALAALAVAKLVQIILSSGPSDSPVKVRGGAMTFSTKPDGSPFSKVGSGYCVSLGGTAVSLKLIQPNGDKTTFPLTSTAQIDLLGRKGDGDSESNNGTRILITSSCNGVNGLSALIQPETKASGFYPNRDDAVDEDGAHIERFMDSSCRPETSPSPGMPGQDADSCERLKNIYIHGAPADDPRGGTPSPVQSNCHNGECVLRLVPQ